MLFSFSGKIKQNIGRGKQLGFPTANMSIPDDFDEGIFIGEALYNKGVYPALVFVGSPITYNEYDKKAEVYLLDFDEDLYGMDLEIHVLKKLRENMKFKSEEELVAQMQEDERQAREYFSTITP